MYSAFRVKIILLIFFVLIHIDTFSDERDIGYLSVDAGAVLPTFELALVTDYGIGVNAQFSFNLDVITLGIQAGYVYMEDTLYTDTMLHFFPVYLTVGKRIHLWGFIIEPQLALGAVFSRIDSSRQLLSTQVYSYWGADWSLKAGTVFSLPIFREISVYIRPDYTVNFEEVGVFSYFSVSAGVCFNLIHKDEERIIDTIDVIPQVTVESVDEKQLKISIAELNFLPESTTLTEKSIMTLKKLSEALLEYRDKKITIIGHTAKVGTVESQVRLSIKRAERIRHYIVEHYDFNPLHISIEGKGASDPVASNETEEGRAQNRRVEIIVFM
jgi:flagellar motor protein MotB